MSEHRSSSCLPRAALILFFLLAIILSAAFLSTRKYPVVATTPASTSVTTSPSTPALSLASTPTAATDTTSIAQAVFNAINQSRASAGLSALKWNDALARSAHQHNLTMAAANQLSHQLPGEPDLGTREKQQGLNWIFAAENIGYSTDMSQQGALSLHKAMMAEQPPNDGHRQNILTTQGTEVGVDILLDNQHNVLWLTEDFAAE
jgi:uncharacterized protein YkwD